jgi:hypothetical protein
MWVIIAYYNEDISPIRQCIVNDNKKHLYLIMSCSLVFKGLIHFRRGIEVKEDEEGQMDHQGLKEIRVNQAHLVLLAREVLKG